jgi:hypothetical protein
MRRPARQAIGVFKRMKKPGAEAGLLYSVLTSAV